MQFSDGWDPGLWPGDMLIAVETPKPLMLLLFVRSVWQLDDNGVPPLESQPEAGSTRAPDALDRADANARWAVDWARAFEVVAPGRAQIGEPDAATRLLLDADLNWDELLQGVSTTAFWSTGLDHEALWAWERSVRRPAREGVLGPEHEAVEWLVPVWRSGLRSIVELPFAGYYAQRVDREHLVVSNATRNDPELYSLALSTM